MRNINEVKAKINRIKRDSRSSRLIKFHTKMNKNIIKYKSKEIYDIQTIKDLFIGLQKGDNIYLFSNKFDSPNLLLYFAKFHKIKELLISTWAITDKGLATLKRLQDEGIKTKLLLDDTYSYKWIFSSGASIYLKNVEFRFTQNHSKMILIRTDKFYITILGSMNLSNNPRFENMNIIENKEVFNFYKDNLNLFFHENTNRKYKQGNIFTCPEVSKSMN